MRSPQISVKRAALRFMQGCGTFALARFVSASMPRILVYHNFCGPGELRSDVVSVAALRSQLDHLRRHFNVVPLARILKDRKAGQPLGRRTLAITIDDGKRNCYEFLFPLLKEFGLPATLFVVSSFIRRDDWLWTDKVLWLSRQPRSPEVLAPEQIDGFFAILNGMRPEKRNACIHALAARMGRTIPTQAPPEFAPCSWAELNEMADSRLVEIGSHTVTHPILASLTDQESSQEISLSRTQLEEGLGRRVSLFCYPNGTSSDYRPGQVRQVVAAGYLGAVAGGAGPIPKHADSFELPRIGIAGWTDPLLFSKRVSGAANYQVKLQALLGRDRAVESAVKQWQSVMSRLITDY